MGRTHCIVVGEVAPVQRYRAVVTPGLSLGRVIVTASPHSQTIYAGPRLGLKQCIHLAMR